VNPYRSGAQPALWLPGVLCVQSHHGDGQIHLGPLAGWRALRGIQHWKRNVVIVEKQAVAPEWPPSGPFTRPLHLRLPEERISAARFPRVHQAALACPVLALTTRDKAALMGARLDFLFVGWHFPSRSGYFSREAGGRTVRSVGGELAQLPVVSIDGEPPPDGPRPLPTIDQILRQLSNGVVTEEAVELAADLLDVLDGAKPLLEHWEDWLEALFRRAAPLEAEARALAEAAVATGSGRLPFYEGIRRARQPAMVIRGSEELSLPAIDRLVVSAVEEFFPESHLQIT
jgi:hypothetical protein